MQRRRQDRPYKWICEWQLQHQAERSEAAQSIVERLSQRMIALKEWTAANKLVSTAGAGLEQVVPGGEEGGRRGGSGSGREGEWSGCGVPRRMEEEELPQSQD